VAAAEVVAAAAGGAADHGDRHTDNSCQLGHDWPLARQWLGSRACLAACGNAPAALLNNFTYLENVTPESLEKLFEDLRKQPERKQ